MPKPHNGGKNGKKRNDNAKRQSGKSQQNATKRKAILKLKAADQTIKTSFMDRKDNEVKELINCFGDGDPKDG
jgi:hypothetical protein